MFIRIKFLVLTVAVLLAMSGGASCWAKDITPYATSGNCDGFPKVDLKTAPGLCVGLVASHLGFARGVAAVGSDIYVVDMGGWRKGHGRLLRLGDDGRKKPEVLLDHLDEPNSVILAPGKMLYISVLGKIIRFDPATHGVQDVVINLPDSGRHPLSALVAAPDGSLFINIGSATDHCEKPDDSAPDPDVPCPETIATTLPRGSLLHVMLGITPIDARTIPPYAVGLRNSMALAISASGQLYAAVNSRDAIDQADPNLSDEDLPHDTFDKIEQGHDYGWPYCYDDNRPSPEYPHYDCSKKTPPTLLLPAHAAPLGMLFYQAKMLPDLDGRLVIGYHGYRDKGHRIVTLVLDQTGLPKSQAMEIVSSWDAEPNNHPQGAPVGLFERDDGSILIAEDQNGTLLRLARN